MKRSVTQRLAAAALAAVAAAVGSGLLAGCVVYEPMPVYQAQSGFDRSWAAALGAMQDEGVALQQQDRATGVIRGTRGSVTVTSFVTTQADGRVRVEFNTTGNADPNLVERISASYHRRMGR